MLGSTWEGGREGGREGERPAMEEQETPTWLCLAGRHGSLQPCLQVHLGGWLREEGREENLKEIRLRTALPRFTSSLRAQ